MADKPHIHYLQSGEGSQGTLQVNVSASGLLRPLQNAVVRISFTGEPGRILEEVTTDENGQTERIVLDTPPMAYSMEPGEAQPYAEYTATVQREDYGEITISGIQVLPEVTAVQPVRLSARADENNPIDTVVIPANTLYGNYPPKEPEPEIKPVNQSGEIVLSQVVIPEYVVVHDGAPTDSTASDYYVRYRDYIKNVASSEIYATWPDATIRANVLAIMSFTLNRVYTEFYRNKGYDFTITSSTAFDHKWTFGRNIFDNISLIVDEMFDSYLSRPNVKQPILTQYCDGQKVKCPNWMTFYHLHMHYLKPPIYKGLRDRRRYQWFHLVG